MVSKFTLFNFCIPLKNKQKNGNCQIRSQHDYQKCKSIIFCHGKVKKKMTSSFQIMLNILWQHVFFSLIYVVRFYVLILYLTCFALWSFLGLVLDVLETNYISVTYDNITSCCSLFPNSSHQFSFSKNDQWSTLLHEWL